VEGAGPVQAHHVVGLWYEDFDQLTDDDVLKALHGG
jgi:predicted phosphoribosyltransferase